MATRSTDGYSYILKVNVLGEKAPGKIGGLFGLSPKPVQLLCGELLTSISRQEIVPRSDKKPGHNFRSKKDPSVTLYMYGGEDDEYVAPVTGKYLELLEAIEGPEDRFAEFSKTDKLEWGGSLDKGDDVYVKVQSPNTSVPTWSLGLVRYAGPVGGFPGRNFEVEIKDSRCSEIGSTDGFFGWYQYFTYEEDCAFQVVSLDKLAREPPHPPGQKLYKSKSATSPSRLQVNTPLDLSSSLGRIHQPFTVGARVGVFNKKKVPILGTIRWMGTDILTRTLGSNHIGIETDTTVITKDFPKALTGIVHLFPARPACRLVVPEEFVFREALDETRRPLARGNDPSNPVTVVPQFGMTRRAKRKRILDVQGVIGYSNSNPVSVPMVEEEDQLLNDPTQQMRLYVGDVKGIQGHQNSCYLDSTIFALFALSDIFDTIFLEPNQAITSDTNTKAVIELFWKGIINPLRKNGVVRYESVMKVKNKLDELGKMEGITEKEKDPMEFLNMLLKHMRYTKPFIIIRRPFGMEKEFYIQLFVKHDPNLKLPTVGELLKRMFKEQQTLFEKVPSRLLIRMPRFRREFKTYQKTVPELKINISELTESFKNAEVPDCFICGSRSDVMCEMCGTLSGESLTYYCQRCSDFFHNNPTHPVRAGHNIADAVDLDGHVGELDLLSVICIETSHYVCFTRDPRDNTERKWIFFDSMADRQYDMYNIPKVTDCTHELNEWVYSGDRTRLMSTQPRQLPELVRRFTQDIYMCVYIQPDVALYGDDDDWSLQENSSEEPRTSHVAASQQKVPSTHYASDQLKWENGSLLAKNVELQQRNKKLAQEKDQYVKHFKQQKLELQKQIDSQQRDNQKAVQQLAEKERDLQQKRCQIRQLKQQFETEREQLQKQNREVRQRLDLAPESTVSQFTKVQIPRQDQDLWNVQRREVVLQEKLGHGAWGYVCKGVFRGQQVAVKCAHESILHINTIDQIKREIRIMAHVQHPNLVRLIAAVVDEGVERRTHSPLIVLELLDTDLRSAYQKRRVDFSKTNLLLIFRDVAYALHYLHEHQDPIIHRDVSAPNVLLQKTNPGVWRAKLSDFGSANLAKHCKTSAAGAIVYSAPETFPPRNPYDPLPKQTIKIDVFSYGYLLAESIAREIPSPEKRATILSRIKQEWAPMRSIITACTEYEPERRLTMTQVLEKLHHLLP